MVNITMHDNIKDLDLDQNLNGICPSTGMVVSCKINDKLIALLTYTKNNFHPHSIILHFTFFRDFNDSEIMNTMFNKLKAKLPTSNYILKLETQSRIYNKFISNNNFAEIRKTYKPDISITTIINYFKSYDSQHNYHPSKLTLNNNLLTKVFDVYKNTHRVNPLGNIDLNTWRNTVSKDLDFNHSIVIYNERNKITAFLLIFDYLEDKKEVGWIYFENDSMKTQLLNQFVSMLYRLQESGITSLCFEIDTTDLYSYELFSPFLINEAPSLITYKKTHK
ncbi:hypothetical protein LNK15_10395 [Jeotgalicoccus huakuii]|nr:hypothetical protein [Jeotgalicoccus huakuii]